MELSLSPADSDRVVRLMGSTGLTARDVISRALVDLERAELRAAKMRRQALDENVSRETVRR